VPSIRAIIKPALLIWARQSLNLTVETAAHKIGVSSDKLIEWESGDSAPTIPQLRKAAEVYKRPLAVFFLAEPPTKFDALHDYRRLPGSAKPTQSPDLSLAVRLARSQREILLEVAEDAKIELPVIDVDLRKWGNSAEAFAEEARKLLKVSLDVQFSWRQTYEALNNWVRALENIGVIVFQTGDVELSEMRGFAIYEKRLPVIVANAKDSPRGRVFTLLHEWAHLLLGQSPLCDLHEDRSSTTDEQRTEVFCNQVAGNILVPSDALEREIKSLKLVSCPRNKQTKSGRDSSMI
jgi:transcriptional regulator with XRE-family HTH domain